MWLFNQPDPLVKHSQELDIIMLQDVSGSRDRASNPQPFLCHLTTRLVLRYDGELKADQPSSQEEDEGFSDGGAQQKERARSRQTSRDSGEEPLPKEASWVSSQPRLRRQERQEEEKEEQQEAPHGREREEVVRRCVREEVSPAPHLEVRPSFTPS